MPFPLMALIGLAASAASSAMSGGGRKRSAFDRRAGDLEMGLLEGTGTDWLNSPTIGGMAQLLRQLMQERQGLQQQLQGLQGLPQITPEIQQYAQQAAFGPLQGLNPALQDALLQAANAANQRGMSQSSIGAALQAQAVPRVMGPAMAQAQGRMGELLLQLPLQQRQLALQGIQTGQGLFGAGLQGAGAQQGLRESAFNQLQRALSRGQSQQQQQGPGAGRRFLGGALGALGSGMLSGNLFGGGGPSPLAQPDLGSMPGYGPVPPPGFGPMPQYPPQLPDLGYGWQQGGRQ